MDKNVSRDLIHKGIILDDIGHPDIIAFNVDEHNADQLNDAISRYNLIIGKINELDLGENLEQVEETIQIDRNKEKGKVVLFRRLALAASIIIICVFAFFFAQQNKSSQFDSYFSHYDELVSVRGNAVSTPSDALYAYSAQEYAVALSIFQSLPEASMTNDLKFYAGVSALGAKDFAIAINYFESIGTGLENRYYEQTRWYLGLGYWQSNEIPKAISTLEGISKGEFKYEESTRLLKLIKGQ